MGMNRNNLRRAGISLVFGGSLGFLPFLFDTFPSLWPSAPLDTKVQLVLGFLSLPGIIIGLVFAAGNVHGISEQVMVAGNVVAYSLVAYWFLKLRSNRQTKSATHPA
jgi:hypothetical protein